ncbi:hypothetical protein ACL6C3_14870 [Capilliphycus salinus ALCB114379]|uniref:hypothetical protein n=1 Tax=Capilliphycus salinus TaxID=2768948 RepID=UPI0039A566E4
MRIESIEQIPIAKFDETQPDCGTIIATKVVFSGVESKCILSRILIDVLGRPGKDNDMELVTSGNRCVVVWTQPQLSIEVAKNLIKTAITPNPKKD